MIVRLLILMPVKKTEKKNQVYLLSQKVRACCAKQMVSKLRSLQILSGCKVSVWKGLNGFCMRNAPQNNRRVGYTSQTENVGLDF